MDKVAYDQKIYDLNLQAAHRLHDRLNEIESHLNDGAFKAADMGLRTCVAINAGAVVSLLAFVGVLETRVGIDGNSAIDSSKIDQLVASFSWFVGGVVCVMLAMIAVFFAYYIGTFSHYYRKKTFEHPFLEETTKSKWYARLAFGMLSCGIVLGVLSLGLFVTGVTVVQGIITHLR